MQSGKSNKISASAQRGKFIRTLRKIHGWLGIWGAVLRLLFGVSGILLNHRAVLKIPLAKNGSQRNPAAHASAAPGQCMEFTRYLQQTLDISHDPLQPKGARKEEKRDDARFMGKDMPQPERWEVTFPMH